MRARVIFRDLTLLISEGLVNGVKAGDNVGTVTALLVSDPNHASMPLHKHTPRMAFNGRDLGDTTGPGRVSKKALMHSPKESTTIQLEGHGAQTGVIVDGSFLDYVPCLTDLHWEKPRGIKDEFVLARIVMTSGTLGAGHFSGWNWNGNTPARVAYMGTTYQGFSANEVVLEMGDDEDFGKHDPKRFLSVSGGGVSEKLWPRTKGAPTDEELSPNYVELTFTNSPARPLRAAPYGLHFITACNAAGYPADEDRYVNSDQYNDFVAAMLEYDRDAWLEDVAMMGHGHPFPYLINPRADRLAPLERDAEPARAVVPPPTPGRSAGEGRSGGDQGHQGHGQTSMTHDPDDARICPQTWLKSPSV